MIIDDFRASWWPLTETLSLTDRYEKRIEVKNGMRQFKPRLIIFTCIHHWQVAYQNAFQGIFGEAREESRQLGRRIDKTSRMEGVLVIDSDEEDDEGPDIEQFF